MQNVLQYCLKYSNFGTIRKREVPHGAENSLYLRVEGRAGRAAVGRIGRFRVLDELLGAGAYQSRAVLDEFDLGADCLFFGESGVRRQQ